MNGIIERIAENKITFDVDPQIYPLKVLMKTAYTFIDKFYVFFYFDKETIVTELRSKNQCDHEQLQCFMGEFFNELLHQTIRLQVYNETKSIRELIFARAFSNICIDTGDDIKDELENVEFYSFNESEGKENGSYKEDNNISKSWFNVKRND